MRLSPSVFSKFGVSPRKQLQIFKTARVATYNYYFSTISSSASPSWTLAENSKFNANMFNLIKRYEDVIGLTEVKLAQQQVLEVGILFSLRDYAAYINWLICIETFSL